MKKIAVFLMVLALILIHSYSMAETRIEKYETMLQGNWEQFATFNTEKQDPTQSFILFNKLTYPAENEKIKVEGFDANYTIYVLGDEIGEVDIALICEGDYYYSAFGKLFFNQDGQVLMIKDALGGIYLYKKAS